LRHHIAYLEGRITEIDDDIDNTVRRTAAWRRKNEVLRSFPGVGKVFCATVLSRLPERGTLSGKAAAALVGIAPFPDDSGGRRGCFEPNSVPIAQLTLAQRPALIVGISGEHGCPGATAVDGASRRVPASARSGCCW
jgi:hypothetical protein